MYDTVESSAEIRLPDNWKPPKEWIDFALTARPEWAVTQAKSTAKKFFEYHHKKARTRSDMEKWFLSWKTWVKNQRTDFIRSKTTNKTNTKMCCIDGCGLEGVISRDTIGRSWICREHYSQ